MTLWEKLSETNRLKIETHYQKLPTLGERLITSLKSKHYAIELTLMDLLDLSAVFTNYNAGEMANKAYEYFPMS